MVVKPSSCLRLHCVLVKTKKLKNKPPQEKRNSSQQRRNIERRNRSHKGIQFNHILPHIHHIISSETRMPRSPSNSVSPPRGGAGSGGRRYGDSRAQERDSDRYGDSRGTASRGGRRYGRRDRSRSRSSSREKQHRHHTKRDRSRSRSRDDARRRPSKKYGDRIAASPPRSPVGTTPVSPSSKVVATRRVRITGLPMDVSTSEINDALRLYSGFPPLSVRIAKDVAIADFSDLRHAESLADNSPDTVTVGRARHELSYTFMPDSSSQQPAAAVANASSRRGTAFQWICDVCSSFNDPRRERCVACRQQSRFPRIVEAVPTNTPSTELLLCGIPSSVNEAELQAAVRIVLGELGPVSIALVHDRQYRSHNGMAFLVFSDEGQATDALSTLNSRHLSLHGQIITVLFGQRLGGKKKGEATAVTSNNSNTDFSAALELCTNLGEPNKAPASPQALDEDAAVREMLQGYATRWGTLRDDQKNFYRANHQRYLPGSTVPYEDPLAAMMADIDAFTKSIAADDDPNKTAADASQQPTTKNVPIIEAIVSGSSTAPTKPVSPIPSSAPQQSPVPANGSTAASGGSVSSLAAAQRMRQMLEEQKKRLAAAAQSKGTQSLHPPVVTARARPKFTDEDEEDE
eukprot:PhM_4_TR1721/c0_g1_i1/m.96250/K13094/RBM5_10; RNA-binding protein 5/10